MKREWDLCGSRTKAKIVQWLYLRHNEDLVSAPNIARAVGLTPKQTYSLLQQLVAGQLVVRATTELGTGYRAPFEDPRLRHLIQLMRVRSDIVRDLQHALRPFRQIECACIFGAFAAGEPWWSSDLEMLLVSKGEVSGEAHQQIQSALYAVMSPNREVRTTWYTRDDFRGLLRSGDQWAQYVISHQMTLKGQLRA